MPLPLIRLDPSIRIATVSDEMKKPPKTFETPKPRIIIIIIIISGFLSLYFLEEGMISSVSTGYVFRPSGKERI